MMSSAPALPPPAFKPHPFCGCERCKENCCSNGAPRHDHSGAPVPPRYREQGRVTESYVATTGTCISIVKGAIDDAEWLQLAVEQGDLIVAVRDALHQEQSRFITARRWRSSMAVPRTLRAKYPRAMQTALRVSAYRRTS